MNFSYLKNYLLSEAELAIIPEYIYNSSLALTRDIRVSYNQVRKRRKEFLIGGGEKELNKSNVVNIHGKEYITVAGRVQIAHEHNEKISITTEFLPFPNTIVCKATVITDKGTFTGTSAANPSKIIERQSPYEVAETSAIGRALGFAGYGLVDSIATADEIVKANNTEVKGFSGDNGKTQEKLFSNGHSDSKCLLCFAPVGKSHASTCPAFKM